MLTKLPTIYFFTTIQSLHHREDFVSIKMKEKKLMSSLRCYCIHFEITGVAYNLIGSENFNASMNTWIGALFCSKLFALIYSAHQNEMSKRK